MSSTMMSTPCDDTSEDLARPATPPELSYVERENLAIKALETAKPKLSVRKAVRIYGLNRTTLQNRLNGMKSRPTGQAHRQRLLPEEESAIEKWILMLHRWGWPPRVDQVRAMVVEVLVKKGDYSPLGVNWVQSFMGRHPNLKSKFVPGLDRDRKVAGNPEKIGRWFELYKCIKDEHNVKDTDIYNMDEKGFMMGVLKKFGVIMSKHSIKDYVTRDGKREWVSLIECISLNGRLLQPWIIFKGKVQQDVWWQKLNQLDQKAHIATSENGWTGNELGLRWIQECFEPETSHDALKDGYRILIFDGYASYITIEAIEFCEQKRIILLCLPPHSTHILQPLDLSFFGLLADAYKIRLQKKTSLGANYSMDKTDFLEFYVGARRATERVELIQKAWKNAGLYPLDPSVVLQQISSTTCPPSIDPTSFEINISIRQTTPPEIEVRINGVLQNMVFTPANVQQAQLLFKSITEQSHDPIPQNMVENPSSYS